MILRITHFAYQEGGILGGEEGRAHQKILYIY